jgi:hypothetical protein
MNFRVDVAGMRRVGMKMPRFVVVPEPCCPKPFSPQK